MYWSGLITLFICVAHSVLNQTEEVFEIEEYNLTIPFNAQTSSCSSCYDTTRVFSPTFTDIPTPGGDKFYVTNFDNPLPPGYLLKGISMVYLVGGFKTSLQVGDDTILSIYFGLQVIHTGVFYDDFLPTSCHNCHIIKNFTSEFNPTGWWPNYRYNTQIYKNEFTINVLQNGVALSKAIITLQAVNFNPQLTHIYPSYIPVGGIGKIEIFANNILNSNFNYKCQFAGPVNVTVEAEIEPGAVYCSFQVPPNLDVVDPFDELYVFFFPDVSGSSSDMVWTNGSIGPKVITLYDQPTIDSVSPTEGDVTGKEVVTIKGSGFFDSPHLYCMFGDPDVAVSIRAVFVDYYSITCETPPTGYSDGQVVVVRVSENGQSWTYNRSVTFMFKVTPWTPLQPVVPPKPIDLIVIIVCSSLFGVFALVAIGYFIYTRRAQKLLYTDIPDIDSSAIIKVSELDIRERIGRGSFGDVHRAYWRYTEVAVKKIFNPSDALLNELYDEARLMITLRHPNIVTFMACTAAQPELCIVTEYVSRGSLYKILHNKNIIFEIDHIRHMALGAAKGMAYLHGSHIIHRDLKSHNLLVDAHWNIKVGDFGLSRAVDQSGVNSTLTACGTPCWTAPEVLRSQRYSFMADVYSFGVCLWEMVTREDPYPGTPAYQVVISVATKNLRPKMPKHINPLCSELIVECWDESPEKRPAFGVLVDKLQSMSLPKSKSPPMVMEGDGSSQTLDSPKDPKGPNAKSAQLKNNMYI